MSRRAYDYYGNDYYGALAERLRRAAAAREEADDGEDHRAAAAVDADPGDGVG